MADNTNNRGDGCCFCLIRFIITAGLTAFFLWLSLRTSNPSFSIQDFSISTLNTSIYFDLKLQNNMNEKGVHYSNTILSVFYNNSFTPVSNFTVPDFYQGHKKTTHRKETVGVYGGNVVVRNGTRVDFRVSVFTRVKFKILFWYTKRRSLVVGGHVAVDDSGRKVGRKGVKLKSGGVKVVWKSYLGLVVLFLLF